MMMKLNRVLVAVGVLACSLAVGAEDLKAQMARESRGALVLCVGSDWCVSGARVEKVYRSSAFRAQVGGKWLFGVNDVREGTMSAVVSNENARVKSLAPDTRRFPALLVYNAAGEPVVRFENLPQEITASQMAQMVQAGDRERQAAEADFAKGAIGPGFQRLAYFQLPATERPSLFYRDRKKGWLARAYPAMWEKLVADTSDEAKSWVSHFTMGDGIDDVTKANGLHEKPEEGKAFIAELRTRPQMHWTVVQRQSVDMAEFAFIRRDESQKAKARQLLKKVFAEGPETFWGWAAYGYLTDKEFGETIEPPSTDFAKDVKFGKGLVDLKLRARGFVENPPTAEAVARLYATQRAKLESVWTRPGTLDDRQATTLARTWVLHEIGNKTLTELLRLEGGRAFVNAFLKDQAWLEDFLASGPIVDVPAAFTNLAALVWNDTKGEILAGGLARTIATAMALQSTGKHATEDLVRTYAGYQFLARAGRLHKAAYTQDVREWRFALGKILNIRDLLYLNDYLNFTNDSYGGACWCVPYRLFNCFGESVQRPTYYRPWRDCTWATQALRPTVGGVCGALSTFGALSANAHGLMASTGGQPGHCAYVRRRANGRWDIHNYVSRFTSVHNTFWGGHAFTYFDVFERSYANRSRALTADRYTWLARLAEDADSNDSRGIEAWYRLAVKTCPKHYGAWRAYSDWLDRGTAPATATAAFLKALVQALPEGRQATWDLIHTCLARIAKDKQGGVDRAVTTLERLYPLLPQPTNVVTREEMNYTGLLERQLKIVGNEPARRMRLFKAALAAQVGRPCFAEVLGWGASWALSDTAHAKEFIRLVESVGTRGKGATIDCRGMMMSAAKTKDIAVFRTVADLFDRLNPVDNKASRYPENDLGGKLLSARAMLTTSSTCGWDKPELHGRVTDATKQPNPRHPNDLGTFHTGKETAPWAIVELPGDAQVTGVYLLNKFGQNAPRQVPFEVFVSEDGKDWTRVYQTAIVTAEYRIKLDSPRRARYVKVAREPDAKNEFFHFGKILVYGKKLY